MTKYDIRIFGSLYSVISLLAEESAPSTLIPNAVYILPSCESDVTALTDIKEKDVLSSLLSFYYRHVLGYPECTLDVTVEGTRFELEIFDTPRGLSGIKLQKCKQIYTTRYTMPDMTEHLLFTVRLGRVYRILPLENDEGFRPSILANLCVSSGLPPAAVAVGLFGERLILPKGVSATPTLAAVGAVCRDEFSFGRADITVSGTRFTVYELDTELVVLTAAELVLRTN